MSAHPRGVRALWLLAAVLQLALPGAAAWADARLDAAGAHAVAHFESHTTSTCARIHPPDCALCRFLSAPLTTRGAATLRSEIAAVRVARPAEPPQPRQAPDCLLPQPRAPPPLS